MFHGGEAERDLNEKFVAMSCLFNEKGGVYDQWLLLTWRLMSHVYRIMSKI
jgi:hypothetical protein